MMSTMYDNGQHGTVSRIDTGNSRGLGKRFRAMLFKFLPALKTQRNTSVVVEPCRYADRLVAFSPLSSQKLLLYVWRVMATNIHLGF